ncbi:MAG: hypothetical protein ABMA64_05315 [Myxococcota bacterium]
MWYQLMACVAVQTSTDPTTGPPEVDTGGSPVDTSGSTTSTTSTTPSTVSGCAAVTGTRGVWLIDRVDPTKVVKSVQPPVSTEVTWDLSGPDALGRLYLLDQSKGEGFRILSSDDGGCTWQLAGSAPVQLVGQQLYTSGTSTQLYVQYSARLYVSADGGASFTQVSSGAPQSRLRVIGGSPDSLWSYDAEHVLSSRDAGVNWQIDQALPTPNSGAAFDGSDPPRTASGGPELHVWDGAAWDLLGSGLMSYGMPMWEPGGALAVIVVAEVGGGKYLLRSEDGIAPLAEVGWGLAPDEFPRVTVVDAGALASGGFLYTEVVAAGAFVLVRTPAGVVVRHSPSEFDDVQGLLFTDTAVVAALQVPLTEQPD